MLVLRDASKPVVGLSGVRWGLTPHNFNNVPEHKAQPQSYTAYRAENRMPLQASRDSDSLVLHCFQPRIFTSGVQRETNRSTIRSILSEDSLRVCSQSPLAEEPTRSATCFVGMRRTLSMVAVDPNHSPRAGISASKLNVD